MALSKTLFLGYVPFSPAVMAREVDHVLPQDRTEFRTGNRSEKTRICALYSSRWPTQYSMATQYGMCEGVSQGRGARTHLYTGLSAVIRPA